MKPQSPHRSGSRPSAVLSAREQLVSLIDKAKPVLDSIGEHIMIVDTEYLIVHDTGVCRNFPTKSFIGSRCHKAYVGLDTPCPDCPMALTYLDGQIHHALKKLVTPAGKTVYIEATSSPLRVDSGEIVGAIEVVRDVSDRVALEEEILRGKNELEQRVREKTAAFSQACLQLFQAEKLAVLGEVAAALIHEFGNSIFGVRNLFEILQDDPRVSSDERLLYRVAIEECNRMKRLVYRLQDMGRPVEPLVEPMDLNQAIQEIVMLNQPRLRDKGIELSSRFCEDLPPVPVIEGQIRQVVLNLLKNAIEAVPKKGGRITISSEKANGLVSVTIHNNGRVISQAVQRQIFAPFFSTKRKKGTGLGLSISHAIVKNHGGSLALQSRPRCGTAFTFTLPVAGLSGEMVVRSPVVF